MAPGVAAALLLMLSTAVADTAVFICVVSIAAVPGLPEPFAGRRAEFGAGVDCSGAAAPPEGIPPWLEPWLKGCNDAGALYYCYRDGYYSG